ncbi:MAG TPA: cupin domain-containing protein [Chitinophagaceae bacterium]|jgi:quercetin dioxygenase-like cupin family protein|nr:cupin domain-containing protein [Chitinophagaceae bacterium]
MTPVIAKNNSAALFETIEAPGIRCVFKITGNDSENKIGIYEITMQPNTHGASLHYHLIISETFIVTSGTLTVQIQDKAIQLSNGDIAHVPVNTAHGFYNDSDESVTFLLIFTPAMQREGFFRELYTMIANNTIDADALSALNNRYDTYPV